MGRHHKLPPSCLNGITFRFRARGNLYLRAIKFSLSQLTCVSGVTSVATGRIAQSALITLSISTLSPTAPASGEYIVIADLRGKDAFSSLAGRIVESYHDLETIEHLDQTPAS